MFFKKIKDFAQPLKLTVDGNIRIAQAARSFFSFDTDALAVAHDHDITGMLDKETLLQLIANGVSLDDTIAKYLSTDIVRLEENMPLEKFEAITAKFIITMDAENRYSGFIINRPLLREVARYYRHTLSRLDIFFRASYNGVIIINTDGEVVVFNRRAEEMTGIKATDILGKSIKDVLPNAGLLHVLAAGTPQLGQKIKFEKAVVVANRTLIEEDNQVIGAMCVFQDITEIDKLSGELSSLKTFNEKLDNIINASYDGIYITDPNGLTLRINKAYERLTGLTKDEVIGHYMRDIVKAGTLSTSITDKVVETRQPVTIEQTTKTGKKVVITGSPVFDENNNIQMIVTNVRDITELSSLRQDLERSRELTLKYQEQIFSNHAHDFIAESEEFKKVLALVHKVAAVDSIVLITGESGAGKEIIAREIQKLSTRAEHPFVKINCGAIPENLMEAELFGYEGGSFTGALKTGKAGLIELAHKGTLLLDEIGELPLNLQVKLLRVIQEGELTRIGATKSTKVDVRFIAATNRNLEEMVAQGTFRADLFYRLNVVPIFIPPLRQRKTDIPAFIAFFLAKFNKKYGTNKTLHPDVIDLFISYHWPGNVRELENVIERMVVTTTANTITTEDLPEFLLPLFTKGPEKKLMLYDIMPLNEALAEVERQLITKAMAKSGSTYKAAKLLGISQPSVVRKIKKYKSAP